MKKIALLFTILGVGALSAMEVPKTTEILGQGMPADLKRVIVSLVSNYKNVTDAVKAIEGLSLANKDLNKLVNAQYGDFNNLQGFAALVHLLANKYDKTTETVAQLFKAPIAKTYVNLGTQLTMAMPTAVVLPDHGTPSVVNLIKQGADVNYTGAMVMRSRLEIEQVPGLAQTYNVVEGQLLSPMFWAIRGGSAQLIELLVKAGAQIQSDEYYDSIDAWPLDAAAKANMKKLLAEKRNQ